MPILRLGVARLDYLGDHLFHRRFLSSKIVRHDFGITVDAQDELRQIVEPIEKPSKISANSLGQITLLGISHIT